jgi:hypothetical protein
MYDVSKETNVRFLRAAVHYLQEQLLLEKRANQALREAKALDEELCEKLSDELLVLRRRFFVGGSERSPRNGADRRSKGLERLLHNEPPIEGASAAPIELDADEVVHAGEAPTCSCGCQMAPMTGGFEESTEIDVTERRYTLRRHKRQKFVCRACSKIVAADGPVRLRSRRAVLASDGGAGGRRQILATFAAQPTGRADGTLGTSRKCANPLRAD